MPWITPVTNRTSGASRMTYLDMNRITGNISYLYNYAKDHGYTITFDDLSKTEWTQNDIVSKQFCDEMASVLNSLLSATGMPTKFIMPPQGYTYVNNLERYILQLWQHIVEPGGYTYLQNAGAIQLQTGDGVDIEAGTMPTE